MEKGYFFSGPKKGGNTMPVVYKIDILAALKDAGYNTNFAWEQVYLFTEHL